jgi:hypothetical protein
MFYHRTGNNANATTKNFDYNEICKSLIFKQGESGAPTIIDC